MAQSILTNTGIASIGRGVSLALGIIVVAVVTRSLGSAQYGVYVLLLSWGAILQTVADFGLYLTLTRDIAISKNEQETINHIASLRGALLLVVFGFGAVLFGVTSSQWALVPVFAVLSFGFSFQLMSQLLMGVYQKYGVVWRATLGDVISRAVQLGGVLLLFFFPEKVAGVVTPIAYVALVFAVSSMVAYGIHAGLLPQVGPPRFLFSKEKWKAIARASWPLGVLLVLNTIYFRVDAIVLAHFRSSEEVGMYGLAYQIIERTLFFPAMFGGLILPRLSALLARNKKLARRLLEQSLEGVLVVAVLAAILLALFSRTIILFLSGSEFMGAVPLLQVLSVALMVMFVGNVFGFSLIALQKQKELLVLYAVLAAGNFVANLIFIPGYGAMAAAATTLATECLATIGAGIIVRKHMRYAVSARLIVSTMGMAAATVGLYVLFPGHWPVLVQISVVGVLYMALGVLFGVIRRSRIQMLLMKGEVS